MMDALARSGALTPEHVRQVARRMAQFHERAPGGQEVAPYGRP
jgi:aminoglycoside phosphotransferase family enzyme